MWRRKERPSGYVDATIQETFGTVDQRHVTGSLSLRFVWIVVRCLMKCQVKSTK
jgi:hypothetical protein